MAENQEVTKTSYKPVPDLSTTARQRRGGPRWRLVGLTLLVLGRLAAPTQAQPVFAPEATCSAELARLFAPAPVAGAAAVYSVCRSADPLDDIRPQNWRIERESASDAFAGAAPEVQRALGLLYGGTRLRVARGFLEVDGFNRDHDGRTFDAFVLIEPAPAETLDRTLPGTLIIQTRVVRPER